MLLISNKEDSRAMKIAHENCIPSLYIQYKDREKCDELILQYLRTYNIDLVIFAGWMKIVTPVLIDGFANRIINIHPSFLPNFKGSGAIERVLEANVDSTGVTVHYVTEKVDDGEIIIQEKVEIYSDDTFENLHKRIQKIEHKIYPKAIKLFSKNFQ